MIPTDRAPIEFLDFSAERVAFLFMWEGQHRGASGVVVEVHTDIDGLRRVQRTVAPSEEVAVVRALALGERDGTTVTVLLPHHRALPRRCSA